MDKKELISIIIPVYNVQNYLERCINSVLNQTYENLEILLVDDGSTDYSGKICDDFAKKDKRVRVFHIANSGVSGARNYALQYFNGEYCAFIDSDDYVKDDYIETLYKDIKQYHAHIACCGCIEIGKEDEITGFNTVRNSGLVISKDKLFLDLYNGYESYGYVVWAKLFSRALLQEVKFGDLTYGEDTVYMLEVFSHNPIVCLNKYLGYYYVQRKDSATGLSNSLGAKREIERIAVGGALLKYGTTNDERLWKKYVNRQATYIYDALCRILILKEKTTYKEYRSILKKAIFEILLNKRILERKYRFVLQLYYHCPNFYWILVRILQEIKYGNTRRFRDG